jgi:aminoglycoside phosphotransferase (APT) family kinase protein
MKMHDEEVDIGADVVRRLVAAQFPRLAGLQAREVPSTGTVNAIYRLGDQLCARLAAAAALCPQPGTRVAMAAGAGSGADAAGP